MSEQTKNRPDYGIDAPGIRRMMLMAGCAGLLVAVVIGFLGLPVILSKAVALLGLVIGVYGLFMGTYMTYGSRVAKLRRREQLLDLAATIRPWNGYEGCG